MPPLLKADWRNLVLLNFAVPTEVVARLAPPGTEPDLYCGRSYVSIVGFRFERIRLFGIPFPFHTNFPEINLRFYVRRRVANELRRGVVFVREIAPRRVVAFVANRLYNESYTTCPMRSSMQSLNGHIGQGDNIEYAWRSPISSGHAQRLAQCSAYYKGLDHWNQLSARVAAPFALPTAGSLNEFIIEHYWGFTRCRKGFTSEFRVAHDPWLVAPADDVTWNCDVSSNYDSPLAEFLAAAPASALIAAGSPVEVFRGRRI